jgi:hypothetical protein
MYSRSPEVKESSLVFLIIDLSHSRDSRPIFEDFVINPFPKIFIESYCKNNKISYTIILSLLHPIKLLFFHFFK